MENAETTMSDNLPPGRGGSVVSGLVGSDLYYELGR